MPKSLEDQLIAYLKDAHGLEQMSLLMTKAAAKTTSDPEMRQMFERHHQETEDHERQIRRRLEAHGQGTSTLKDIAGRVAAIGKGVAATLPSDTPARLARDGYVHEHTEIAAYELLARVADRAGDTETADVARRILSNERETAERIASSWDHAAELALQPTVGAAA